MPIRRYDFQKHECTACQTLMNYEYFKKWHDLSECFIAEMQKLDRERRENEVSNM